MPQGFSPKVLAAVGGALTAVVLLTACGGTPASSPTSTAAAAPTPLPSGTLTHVDIPPLKGSQAQFDIMVVDQDAHRLYAADHTDNGIDVLDVSTQQAHYIRTLTGSSPNDSPNGIVVAKDQNKLFAANTDSTVTVFDLASGKLIATLSTGGKGRADELDYDSKDHKVYVANSDDGFVTVIDASSDSILKKIDNISKGSLEQPRYDPADGKVYLNLSDDNAIAEIDPTTDTVAKKFPIGVPCSPNGIGIDPAANEAVLGCSDTKNQQIVVWDLAAGKVVSSTKDSGAADAVAFDSADHRFIVAAAGYKKDGKADPHLSVFGGVPVAFQRAVPTVAGAHSVAYEETNHVAYIADHLGGGLFATPIAS